MTYQVRMTSRAEQDVDTVLDWFHNQGLVKAGERWLTRLMAKVNSLERHPERCHMALEAEEMGINLREILFGGRGAQYRILFRIERQIVFILHIRHAARDRLTRQDL